MMYTRRIFRVISVSSERSQRARTKDRFKPTRLMRIADTETGSDLTFEVCELKAGVESEQASNA